MYLTVDENLNCESIEGRVFNERTAPRPVSHVLRARSGQDVWCALTGLDAQGQACPALARKVDDSGEGTCTLVYGGAWGLRLKDPICKDPWSIDDPHQWGEPFLLLGGDAEDVRFTSTT